MLQDLLGAQLDLPVRVAIATIVIAALLGLTVLIVRRLSGSGSGGMLRSRQARLAVVDSVAVDPRRRLVLVRRDEVEHLLLVGGTTDIVVEPAIGRATGRDASTTQRDLPARETPALRDTAPSREPTALREPPAREALSRRPSPAALSAPPFEAEADIASSPSHIEGADSPVPVFPAPVAEPASEEMPEPVAARPASFSPAPRPVAPPSEARRPLPQRRPLRSEEPAPSRPARPLTGVSERFSRPTGALGLTRASLASEPGAVAAAATDAATNSAPSLAPSPAAPDQEEIHTAIAAPATDSPEASPAAPATSIIGEVAPEAPAPAETTPTLDNSEVADVKPVSDAIPVFDMPAPEQDEAPAAPIEEPAPVFEPAPFAEPAPSMSGPSLPVFDEIKAEDAAPAPETTSPTFEAPVFDAPATEAPAAAPTEIEATAPLATESTPPSEAQPAEEPVFQAQVSEAPIVVMPAAPLLPEMPLSPAPEPEAPQSEPETDSPAPAAPSPFRRVPMFSISRPPRAPAAERTEPQIGDLAKRLESSLGEALGTPPSEEKAAEAPPPPRPAPRIGPARFSPVMRAGITTPTAPPRPVPRDVRPQPAPPAMTSPDLGLEADLVRQLELTLAREAEADEAARAAARAEEDKAAQETAKEETAVKSSDPFDDLEAEMATLLGRSPGAR